MTELLGTPPKDPDCFFQICGVKAYLDKMFEGPRPRVGDRVEMICVASEDGVLRLKLQVAQPKG